MIKITTELENELIKNITVAGHAGFDRKGKDIVCASVSSMVLVSINACFSIDDKVLEVEENEAFIRVNKKYENVAVDKILLNLVRMLEELKESYPKNIQINER